MDRSTLLQSTKGSFVRGLKTWALPRLMDLPPSGWDKAIREAQSIDFDAVERTMIILGVVVAAYVLRIEPGTASRWSLPAIYLVQFVQAVPLLVLLAGPAYLRRARRGLDKVIANRSGNADSEPDDMSATGNQMEP